MTIKERIPLTPTPSIDRDTPLPDIGRERVDATRFSSPDFMRDEWQYLWKEVWNIGPRVSELKEPGDYVLHSLGKESFIFVLDQDEKIRGFYNVCQHRGNRLLESPACGKARFFKCQFHNWGWNIDGSLKNVADPDSFPQFKNGIPKDELALPEVSIDTWAGWVWFNLSENPQPLAEFLGPLPEHLAPYEPERMVFFKHKTFLWDCNWKVACDAFNESYHFRGIHPQMLSWSNDEARIELLGLHSRMINEYATISPRNHDKENLSDAMKAFMLNMEIDPDTYEGKPEDVRLFQQQRSRSLQDEVPFPYKHLTDEQLSDTYHYFVFPNVAWNVYAEGINGFRYRPHETDPNKCYYDLMLLTFVPEGEEIPYEHKVFQQRVPYSEALDGEVPDFICEVLQQDADNVEPVQRGVQSDSFKGMILGDQEIRLRHFHNCLNEFIENNKNQQK